MPKKLSLIVINVKNIKVNNKNWLENKNLKIIMIQISL